jgi:hypothetical protein
MTRRARAIAIARRRQPPALLPWLMFALLLATAVAAHAQGAAIDTFPTPTMRPPGTPGGDPTVVPT